MVVDQLYHGGGGQPHFFGDMGSGGEDAIATADIGIFRDVLQNAVGGFVDDDEVVQLFSAG
jgi:hypothetical protein